MWSKTGHDDSGGVGPRGAGLAYYRSHRTLFFHYLSSLFVCIQHTFYYAKRCIGSYRLPFLLLSVLEVDLRARATAPSPREAKRTALRTLRILFPSPPPCLAFFDDEEPSSFLISAKFVLLSASTDFSVGSN
jgi:hypothetical protein